MTTHCTTTLEACVLGATRHAAQTLVDALATAPLLPAGAWGAWSAPWASLGDPWRHLAAAGALLTVAGVWMMAGRGRFGAPGRAAREGVVWGAFAVVHLALALALPLGLAAAAHQGLGRTDTTQVALSGAFLTVWGAVTLPYILRGGAQSVAEAWRGEDAFGR